MDEPPEKKKRLNDDVYINEPGYPLEPNDMNPFDEDDGEDDHDTEEEEEAELEEDLEEDMDEHLDEDLHYLYEALDDDLGDEYDLYDLPQLNWGIPDDEMGEKSASLEVLPTMGTKEYREELKQRRNSV